MAKVKTRSFATNVQMVSTAIFKLSALSYGIGLCGALENGDLTPKQFVVKIVVVLSVLILG